MPSVSSRRSAPGQDEASDIEQAMGQYAGLYRPQSNYGDNGVEAREQAGARRTNSVHAGNVIQQRQNMAAFRPESVYGDLFSNATGCATMGVWNSLTVQGISNYPPEYERSPEEIMVNYEQEINEYFRTNNHEKRELLKSLFLHTLLPYMEEILKVHGSPSVQMLKVLPFLCCSRDSHVSRYALYLTLNVLSKCTCDVDEKMQSFLVDAEEQIRQSIVSEGSVTVFDVQTPEDQGLRVFVYSRVLMLLILLIKHGQIRTTICSKVVSICNLERKLMSLSKQTPFKERKTPRYAVACIHQAIGIIKNPLKGRPFWDFLDWLQRYYQNNVGTKREREKFLNDFVDTVTIKHKSGWFDYHVVVFCLQPRIHKDPKVIEVLLGLVHQYIQVKESSWNPLKRIRWSEEVQWQTGLHLSSILEDIAMQNRDEATRRVACGVLCLYSDSLNKNNKTTNYNEKLFLEQSLEKCCLGPGRGTILPMVLSKLNKEDPITVLSSMSYLESTRYKHQMIPHSYKFLFKENDKGFFKTTFRGEHSVVKILDNSSGDPTNLQAIQSKHYRELLKEAYVLRRLNVSPHPNIVRVFAYDTHSEPYHIITEYADKGTLLQFLQDARYDIHPLPKPSILLQMILGVINGLLYLLGDDRHLVHQAIMSSNILVSSDRTCKLTGFQALQQMAYNEETNLYEYISKRDETSIRHAPPETLTDGRYSEKSMVFHCGCVLFEMFTYGNTPYNWISDSEADLIRSHVLREDAYLEEKCIPKDIDDIRKGCHSFDPYCRPPLTALRRLLEDVQGTFTSCADKDRPSTDYQPLTKQDKAHTSLNSCHSLDQLEHTKVLGIFGFQTVAHDRAAIQNIRGIPKIRELVEKTKEGDLKKLKDLNNRYIVTVLSIVDVDGQYNALYTEYSEQGNLLDLVLAKKCTSIDLVRFLVQILSGLTYLHDSNMLHGDLRAENIMVFYDERQIVQVKIARLGRSMLLRTSLVECPMPEDAKLRNAPEVIKNNIYSISSDVWSFALMCYELYDAQGRTHPCQPEDVEPIKCNKEEILAYLEGNNRPEQPPEMPDWLYITVKQGLLHKPEERPPPILLHDCLTYKKPFDSCLLSRWKEYHPDLIQKTRIDVSVEQPVQTDHNHIVPPEQHISFEVLKGMSPVAVFMEHSYRYTQANEVLEAEDEDYYDDIYDPFPGYNSLERTSLDRRVPEAIYEAVGNIIPTQRKKPLQRPPDGQQASSCSPPLPPKPMNLPPIIRRQTLEAIAQEPPPQSHPRILRPDICHRRPAPLPRQTGASRRPSPYERPPGPAQPPQSPLRTNPGHSASSSNDEPIYINIAASLCSNFPSENSEPSSLISNASNDALSNGCYVASDVQESEELYDSPGVPTEMSYHSIPR